MELLKIALVKEEQGSRLFTLRPQRLLFRGLHQPHSSLWPLSLSPLLLGPQPRVRCSQAGPPEVSEL